jgi:MFS family permease
VRVLRNSAFFRLWIGSTISLFGDQFYLVALPWLIVGLTSSTIALSTIFMTAAIPRAVLMLVGGAFTDRYSPRFILAATATARAILVFALAVLTYTHQIVIWHLYILAGLFGIADAFALPASRALLPSVVSGEELQPANSLSQTSAQLSGIIGPLPAGLAVRAFGIAQAFFIDAVSFVFVIVALLGLPAGEPKPRAAQSMWASIVAGLRYVLSDRPLSSLMLLAAALNFGMTGPASVGLVLVAQRQFGSASAFAALVSALAVGSLAGTVGAGALKLRSHRGLLLLGGAAAIGILLGAIPFVPTEIALIALLVAIGVTAGFVNVSLQTWLQLRIDPEMRGRALSVLSLAVLGLMPLSLAFAGVLALIGLPVLFLTSAGIVIVAVAVGFFSGRLHAVQ